MGKNLVITVFAALLCALPAMGATCYVDGSVAVPGDGRSWGTAFRTIQEGIDASANGDTVVVGEGTYVENIRLKGKNLTLTSINPFDPATVRNTVIDGNRADSVVSFDGTETEACVLMGFTIQNGKADYGGGVRGGTQDKQTTATIRNNVFVGNRADLG